MLKPIPKNIVFIAACNPFKMKKINPEKEDDVINVHPDMKNLLSHRVFPIPPRILFDLWDYGSLYKDVEEKYIRAMLSQLKLEENYLNCFVEAVLTCQNFIRSDVEKQQSSVSLRDIKRVIRIFKFYYNVIAFRRYVKEEVTKSNLMSFVDGKGEDIMRFDQFCEEHKNNTFEKINEEDFLICFIISILINYIFRISKSGIS